MKTKIGLIILLVVCVGLAVVLFVTKQQANEEKKQDTEKISTLSNKWVETSGKLEEQKQVNVSLEQEVDTGKKDFAELTNKYSDLNAMLEKTDASLKAAQEDLSKREAKIADLEAQNRTLDQHAADLSAAITNLTGQIEDTKRKLAASEGDKAFLEKELKRLIAEKAELERRFNDLVVLRAQVAKLKEEMNISRRLEWIRKGLFDITDRKGAQQLMQQGTSASAAAPEAKPSHYDLNVEIGTDGSVRVIPPLTNRPAATPPSGH